MRFEWDEAKNQTNQKKHLVSFEMAMRVFDDPNVVEYPERIENGEERWHAIGFVPGSLLLLLTVAHTWNEKNQVVRIMRQISEEELRRPLTDEQKREIRVLEEMPDSAIDFSDIPEITEIPPGAVRGLLYRGNLIRLPEDLRKYFADLAARRRVPMNDLVVDTLQKALEVAETVR